MDPAPRHPARPEPPPTPEVEAIEPEFRPDKVREVTALFLNHALPPSVLVMLEDTHWMDDASSVVLDQIVAPSPHDPR